MLYIFLRSPKNKRGHFQICLVNSSMDLAESTLIPCESLLRGSALSNMRSRGERPVWPSRAGSRVAQSDAQTRRSRQPQVPCTC